MRSLADFAFRRGDRGTAEQLWQNAILRGETYVRHHPTSIRSRAELCWACISFHESVLSQDPQRIDEADRLLARGVEHAEEMQRQDRTSASALDVLASLHFRQGLAAAERDNIKDAIPSFRLAMTEIEDLCEAVPWNADYWNTSCWFREESIRRLHDAGLESEVDVSVEQSETWFSRVSNELPGDAVPQKHLAAARSSLSNVLHAIGYKSNSMQSK